MRLAGFSTQTGFPNAQAPHDGYLLTFRAKMKAGNLQGVSYPEMTIGQNDDAVSRGVNLPVTGTTDWASVETSFRVEKGEPPPDKFNLRVVIEGKGTVWIKDVEFLRGPLPK